MIIYKDWQHEQSPLGDGEILEFLGYTPKFELDGASYRGEKCLVRFTDGTEEEVILRVPALPDTEYIPRRDMVENYYSDRFQVFKKENGKSEVLYDTTFWNNRIEDFTSFGNIY